MKHYFMTATSSIAVGALVQQNLPDVPSVDALFAVGAVWMNQKRIMDPRLQLTGNDTVIVYIDRFQWIKYKLDPNHIIVETDDILVVYKPSLVNVAPDRLSLTNNLTYGVNTYLADQGLRYQSSAITRLDKPVQGLVLYPKTKFSEKHLFYEMRHHRIKKMYTAFVEGCGHVDFLRIKDALGFKKHAYITETGKASETIIRKKNSYDKYEEYTVIPITGRQHQIRCHLAHRVAPIIGDREYGATLSERGVGLVACGLNFKCNGQKYRIRLAREKIVLKTIKVEE